ncbi:MAG TPA: LacI family DNA-binding transcriptional regulator [Thermoanaerobaculia bacterium]|nr:LacI family DNA-binding transcriptional regulator [Thermoanaerobaculia bacterium]
MPLSTASPRPGSSSRSRATTIKEVAARAGVSVATVSRALNGIGPVRKATLDRVMEAARALRFVPHSGARSLSTRTTHTVGLVLPDLHGEFFSEVIRGADLAARRRGYHLIVSGSHNNPDDMAAVLRAMRGRVDGLILMSPELAVDAIVDEVPAAMPVITVNVESKRFGSVTIDNYDGARAMLRHLAALGHARIAFILGPRGNADAAERLRGYRDGCRAHSIVNAPELEIGGDFSEASGYAAALQLLDIRPQPTAIFAANDAMAVGALFALREKQMRVPEDMALVGFDDIPIARYVTPRLTTVTVAIAELGRRAFELLLESIGNKSSRRPPRETLSTTLVVRDSCGARHAAAKRNRRSTGGIT